MIKTITVALLAIAMSAGLAQARIGHKHVIPGCALGHPVAATCACGTAANHPLLCHKGQWCHTNWSCTS
jgi:hypothetical protein